MGRLYTGVGNPLKEKDFASDTMFHLKSSEARGFLLQGGVNEVKTDVLQAAVPAVTNALTPGEISDLLKDRIDPSRILIREIERIAFASDASFYRLIPRAVVQPIGVEEVRHLFHFSHEHQVPLVFRAGGTSLSGQSITDGVLVDIGRHFRGVRVEENGQEHSRSAGIDRSAGQRCSAAVSREDWP